MDIPFYYDPMIAKLICHAEDRQAAIAKMTRAIDEYEITGLETTLPFCRFVILHDAFMSGNFDTRFVEKHFSASSLETHPQSEEIRIAAALATLMMNGKGSEPISSNPSPMARKWKKSRS
jgi:propionyl-CoA carboxylase alpha chain